jgi:hypothetical protein
MWTLVKYFTVMPATKEKPLNEQYGCKGSFSNFEIRIKKHPVDTGRSLTIACHMKIFEYLLPASWVMVLISG